MSDDSTVDGDGRGATPANAHGVPPLKPATPAAAYVALYPGLVECARQYGYALALHGSLGRDLDAVAVPWVEDAAPAAELAEALRSLIGAVWGDGSWMVRLHGPEEKPHGRLAWSLSLGSGAVLDLSVMPRATGRG